MRIWYGEDLSNSVESDNRGTHCVDVYIKCYGTCTLQCREDDVCSDSYVDALEATSLNLNCHGDRACQRMSLARN